MGRHEARRTLVVANGGGGTCAPGATTVRHPEVSGKE